MHFFVFGIPCGWGRGREVGFDTVGAETLIVTEAELKQQGTNCSEMTRAAKQSAMVKFHILIANNLIA